MEGRVLLHRVCILVLLSLPYGYAARDVDALLTDHGSYKVHVRNISQCRHDRGYLSLTMRNKEQVVIAQFHVDSEIGPLMLKMSSWKLSDSQFVPLTHFTISKPCHHYFFGPVIRGIGNLTENCFLRRGDYNVVIPTDNYTHKMFGKQFFRGVYKFRILIYSKKTVIVCEDFVSELSAI